MNIKVPKTMRSPTVIIVGGGAVDEKKNDFHAKRMDNLEKKLDQQYERFQKKTPPVQDFSPMIKSFTSKIGSLEKTIKKLADSNNGDDNSDLIKAFEKIVNRIEKNKPVSNPVDYKAFMSKLGTLEEAIRDLPTQRVSVNTSGLSKSFNTLYERLEKAIRAARPRMIPSPS